MPECNYAEEEYCGKGSAMAKPMFSACWLDDTVVLGGLELTLRAAC